MTWKVERLAARAAALLRRQFDVSVALANYGTAIASASSYFMHSVTSFRLFPLPDLTSYRKIIYY